MKDWLTVETGKIKMHVRNILIGEESTLQTYLETNFKLKTITNIFENQSILIFLQSDFS